MHTVVDGALRPVCIAYADESHTSLDPRLRVLSYLSAYAIGLGAPSIGECRLLDTGFLVPYETKVLGR